MRTKDTPDDGKKERQPVTKDTLKINTSLDDVLKASVPKKKEDKKNEK